MLSKEEEMKRLVSLFQRAGNAIASRSIALINHRLENHLRWIQEESSEETQWGGSDPYIVSVLKERPQQ